MYQLPSELNATSWTDILIWANVVTNYWFGNAILIAIFFIAFLTFMFVDEPDKAFLFASFIATVMAILFRGIGIIGDVPIIIGIVCVAIGFLILKKKEE